MPLNDILLQLDTYPDPTPLVAIDWAVSFAARLQGKQSALAVQVKFPLHRNRMADYLVGLSGIVHDEETKSLSRCHELLQHFEARAIAAGVLRAKLLEQANVYDVGERIACCARTRDLCIVPLVDKMDGQQSIAEAVIFGSGRPVIVLQAGPALAHDATLGTVVVAWDGSPSAARALADATPILGVAKQVRILTVLNEKPTAVSGLSAEPLRHLQTHGIKATADEIDLDGSTIGAVLECYVRASPTDLLVMGAFGHSRLREFLLGGATQSMLSGAPVPVLFSH